MNNANGTVIFCMNGSRPLLYPHPGPPTKLLQLIMVAAMDRPIGSHGNERFATK